METAIYRGDGLIIDVRSPKWHQHGTIPGSVNIPIAVFEKGPHYGVSVTDCTMPGHASDRCQVLNFELLNC